MTLVPVSSGYFTNDLTYFPQIRLLQPEILSRIDQFYPYDNGSRLLLCTYDRRVFRTFRDTSYCNWAPLEELDKLSSFHLVSVATAESLVVTDDRFVVIGVLTSQGQMFVWRERHLGKVTQKTRVRRVRLGTTVSMITGSSNRLYALDSNGTVWKLDVPNLKPRRVEEFLRYGRILSIASDDDGDLLTALTVTGKCIVRKVLALVENQAEVLSVGWLASLPSPPVQIAATSGSIYILAGDSRVYACNDFHPRSVNRGRAKVIGGENLPPIRQIHSTSGSGILILESESNWLFKYPKLNCITGSISVADLYSLLSTPKYPGFIRITAHARWQVGLLNNLFRADLQLSLFKRDWFQKFQKEEESRLSQVLSEPRIGTLDILDIELSSGSIIVYLQYLCTGSTAGFERHALSLYSLSLVLNDFTLLKFTVSLISRKLVRLYQLQKFGHFRKIIEEFGKTLDSLTTVQGFSIPNVIFVQSVKISKPDHTLQARLVRYAAEIRLFK